MVTNEKRPKEFGKALVDGLGFLAFLLGSLVLVSLVFGMIGSLFMSTRPLFRAKRGKNTDDKKTGEPEEEVKEEKDTVKMVEEIQDSIEMEIRPNSQAFEYLEAVIERESLESLEPLLMKHLGLATKEPGKEVNLPIEVQRFVDSMGGVRAGQSFYYRQGRNNGIEFALLWPWASNPNKITLKAGSGSI